MGLILQQVAEIRQTIERVAAEQMPTMRLLGSFIIGTYILSLSNFFQTRMAELLMLTVMLVLAIPYSAVRTDYLEPRAGGWIKEVEQQIREQAPEGSLERELEGWENWKAKRRYKWFLMPFVDLCAALIILYIFYKCEARLWYEFHQYRFVKATVAALVVSPGIIKFVSWLAPK